MRASYFHHYLPDPDNSRMAVAEATEQPLPLIEVWVEAARQLPVPSGWSMERK